MKQKKICIVTTLWSSINNWIKPFLSEYNKYGIEVTIVCNMDSTYESQLQAEYPFVKTFPIAFPRGMSIFGSITSIYKLYKFLASNNFDLIQYSTPNASMYGAVAAKLARIPVRLYCQWGMVFVTRKGFTRWIFKTIERFICRFSTEIQPDSLGNLEYCRSIGLYDARKSVGLSQEEVAEKLNVARQTISKWELDETIPDLKQGEALSKIYGKELSELINEDEYKEIKEVLKNTNEKNADKINWTKVWSKKYPVLGTYQSVVDVDKYAKEISRLLTMLEEDYNYNKLDAMLVLKDILAHTWKDNK